MVTSLPEKKICTENLMLDGYSLFRRKVSNPVPGLGVIALIPGSNLVKESKPQDHLHFMRDHQTWVKWPFGRFLGVFAL